MTRPDPPGIHAYRHPAGGWDALEAVAAHLHRQRVIKIGTATLLHSNQPDGFDCPGCAWPDASHTSTFEFCENGAKAVAWEATALRVTRQFFEDNDVASLRARSDHWLESQGRLTEPMAYEPRTDRFVPIAWEDAFRRVAAALHAIDRPDQAEFYTSGRASNEAAFLYQLFARAFGTNNFPDCSNLCHEPTSVGLPRSLGVGKGTVTLDDFDECDAIFSFGHNPGTNHPRMMTTLRSAARRGARIVTFNPMRERSLERFAAPQDPVEMVTLSSTAISTQYHQVRVGGDVAALKGLAKAVFALDDDARCAGMPRVLDVDFIQAHCLGFEAFEADIRATAWQDIEGSPASRTPPWRRPPRSMHRPER